MLSIRERTVESFFSSVVSSPFSQSSSQALTSFCALLSAHLYIRFLSDEICNILAHSATSEAETSIEQRHVTTEMESHSRLVPVPTFISAVVATPSIFLVCVPDRFSNVVLEYHCPKCLGRFFFWQLVFFDFQQQHHTLLCTCYRVVTLLL